MAAKTRRLISNIYRQNRQKAISGGNVNSMQDTQGAVAGALEAEYNVDANRRFNYDQMASTNANAAANRALDATRINATISYQNDLLDMQKDKEQYEAIKNIAAFDSKDFNFGFTPSQDPDTVNSGTGVSSNPANSSPAISSSGSTVGVNKTGENTYSKTYGPDYSTVNAIDKGLSITGQIGGFVPGVGPAVQMGSGIGKAALGLGKFVYSLFNPDFTVHYSNDYTYGSSYGTKSGELVGEYEQTGLIGGKDEVSASGGSYGGTSDSGWVLCSELVRQGGMDQKILDNEWSYIKNIITIEEYSGYRVIADPLVKKMQHSKLFTFIIAPFIRSFANEMASRVNNKIKGNKLGTFILWFGLPLCRAYARKTVMEVA
jgi:hypothetical protein